MHKCTPHPFYSSTECAAKLQQTNNYQQGNPGKTIFTTCRYSRILPLWHLFYNLLCLYMSALTLEGGSCFVSNIPLTRQRARRVTQCTASRVSGKLPKLRTGFARKNQREWPTKPLTHGCCPYRWIGSAICIYMRFYRSISIGGAHRIQCYAMFLKRKTNYASFSR